MIKIIFGVTVITIIVIYLYRSEIKYWWLYNFCSPFPEQYDPHCFDCNEGPKACDTCPYKTW